MTTHDNAPPPAEWRCDPRPCECFTRADMKPPASRDEPHIIRGEN